VYPHPMATPGLFDGTPLERPVTCERCHATLAACKCPRNASGKVLPPSEQQVRVRRERRNGKWVTVASGIDPVANDLKGLLQTLKKKFSTGGTLGDASELELQGDHRDALVTLLKDKGFAAKASGG
jgi:translation initiation factor 1